MKMDVRFGMYIYIFIVCYFRAYKVYRLVCEYELETPKYTEEEFIQKIMDDDDFNRVWGELGPIYGKQWRNWEIESQKLDDGVVASSSTDQIRDLLHILENNPDSRRMMVNAWNVSDLHHMTLLLFLRSLLLLLHLLQIYLMQKTPY